MRKYSAIVFDLGNVLIDIDYSEQEKYLNSLEPGFAGIFASNFKKNVSLHKELEKGLLSEDDFISGMLKDLGGKITGETFKNVYSGIFTVNNKMAELLSTLKNKYKLILLSNTNEIHRKYGWGEYDFLKYFDEMILSHEAGTAKPDPAIYEQTEKAAGLPPEELIFIDDLEENVEAARKRGWDAVQFTGYDDLISELEKRNIV